MSSTHSFDANHHRHLLRSQSACNRFTFRRDYVTSKLMTKMEALFVQDVVNRATMKKIKRRRVVEADGTRVYFLCTVEFLINSLDWDAKIQQRLLASLQAKGFIRVKFFGLPRRRYLWIDIVHIENELDKCIGVNDPSKKGSNDHDLPESNDPGKNEDTAVSSVQREETHSHRFADDAVGGFQLGQNNQGSPLEKKLVESYYKLLLENGKVLTTEYRPRVWQKQFKQAIQTRSLVKVQEALTAYTKHFRDQFMVRCYDGCHSAKKFCENIQRVLDCAVRIEEKQRGKTKRVYDHCETIDLGNGRIQKKPVYIEVPEDERPVID